MKMDNEVLVRVEHVSRKFCRSLKRSLWYGVQDMLSELNPSSKLRTTKREGSSAPAQEPNEESFALSASRNGLRRDEFWAVNDVSFELRPGECLGLIGRNGAGKTTLLKMLNGLIKPDGGRIEMRGRVGALISLGAGFNPILTGRENIYVNGSVLGLTKKEIDAKIDDIIDFADIGDFINTPVQSYSSGMQVRLGFAIATAISPEILLLDEVLAVGDMAFRIKCYERIGRLQKNAATILVSHSMSHLSTVCNRIFFMSHGKGSYYMDRKAGIQRYIEDQTSASAKEDFEPLLTFIPPFRSASIGIEPEQIQHGDDVTVLITMDSCNDLDNLQLRCSASTEEGNPVLVWDGDWRGQAINVRRGRQVIRVVLGPIHLTAGRYVFHISLTQPGNGQLLLYSRGTASFEITSKEIYSEVPTTFGLKHLAITHNGTTSHL